jgi:hypothetical protein
MRHVPRINLEIEMMSIEKRVRRERKESKKNASVKTRLDSRDLRRKIKRASTLLDDSCGWAVDVTYFLAGLDSAFIEVQGRLKALDKALRRRESPPVQMQRIAKVLPLICDFTERMAGYAKQFTDLDVIGDGRELFELEGELFEIENELKELAQPPVHCGRAGSSM